MRAISRRGKDQRGQILVLLLIILAISALAIPSLLAITSAAHRSTDISNEETQQFYAADSGIEHALSMIGNRTWLDNWMATGQIYSSGDFLVNDCSVAYTIAFGNDTFDIESIATLNEGAGASGVAMTRIVRSHVPHRTLTINVNPPEGGTTVPATGNYTYPKGTVVSLEAICSANFEFGNWTDESGNLAPVGNPYSQSTSITMDSNYAVAANFVEQGSDYWLDLNVDPALSGTTTPAAGVQHWYNENDIVNISAVANPGYTFGYWYGDDTSTVGNVLSPDTTVTMQGNYTLYAFFNETYSLTITSTAGGDVVAPGEGIFSYIGATNDVLLVANAYGGYEFLNWSGDTTTMDSPTSSTTYIDVNGDYAISANFKKDLKYPCMKFAMASIGEGEDVNITKPPVRVTYAVDGDIYVKGDVTIAQLTPVRGNVYAEGAITLEKGAEISGNAHGYGNIYLQEGAIVDGNAYAGNSSVIGNIVVDRNGIIRGDAYARGDITLNCQGGSCGQILGEVYPNYSPMPEFPPTYEPDWLEIANDYKSDAETGGNYTGDYLIPNDGVVNLGPLHITGNLDVGNGATVTLSGTVYVDGEVYLNPGCILMGPGFLLADQNIQIWTNNDIPGNSLPVIMSVWGGIDCKNTSELRAVLYAPHGTVTLWNVTSVYGAVMGWRIDPRNNFSVDYAEELLGMMDCS